MKPYIIVASVLISFARLGAAERIPFSPGPKLEFCQDKKDERYMILLEDFTYTDPQSYRWTARAGLKTDGASIPPCLWSFVGSPYTGPYRYAAIVHDEYCPEKSKPPVHAESCESVHKMFYDACIDAGVGKIRASVMYYAIVWFGPRWKITPEGTGAKKVTILDPKLPQENLRSSFLVYLNTTGQNNLAVVVEELPPAVRAFSGPDSSVESKYRAPKIDANAIALDVIEQWVKDKKPSLEELDRKSPEQIYSEIAQMK